MQAKYLLDLLKDCKEKSLTHRYINNDHVLPLLDNFVSKFLIEEIGNSVKNESIFSITVGKGKRKILMWSQMHGNESTTTKALFDVLNILSQKNEFSKAILEQCTIKIIPILNPDGARLYTRLNANKVDLNRDAQNQSQPESVVLLDVFNNFKPDFCFNLHGQRTIYSAGNSENPATLSFLAPAQNIDATLTNNRKQAMDIIVAMNNMLQQIIPNQVGIYDDSFNINCVGDTFQSSNTPTILFEAGHYANDYSREEVRTYIGVSLLTSIYYIANSTIDGSNFVQYFSIPKNDKLFFDVIIRNAKLRINDQPKDLAFQFEEVLVNNKITFIPKLEMISKLDKHFGHIEINANSQLVLTEKKEELFIGYENVFVLINNELFALNSINN